MDATIVVAREIVFLGFTVVLPGVCFPEHMLHHVPQVVGMSVPHIADQSWDGVSFVLIVLLIVLCQSCTNRKCHFTDSRPARPGRYYDSPICI